MDLVCMNQKIPCSFCGSKRGKPSHWTKGKEFHVFRDKKYLAEPKRLTFVLNQDVYVCRKCKYALYSISFLVDFRKTIFFKFFK